MYQLGLMKHASDYEATTEKNFNLMTVEFENGSSITTTLEHLHHMDFASEKTKFERSNNTKEIEREIKNEQLKAEFKSERDDYGILIGYHTNSNQSADFGKDLMKLLFCGTKVQISDIMLRLLWL